MSKTTSPLIVHKLADVARLFSVSSNSIKEWRDARGMPVEPDGTFDLVKILAWWRARQQKAASPSQQDSKAKLEARKLKLECERRELALRRAQGQLVEREAAKARVSEMFHRVRARLQAAPEEMTSSLPADIRTMAIEDARHRIMLILREMESWSPDEDDE